MTSITGFCHVKCLRPAYHVLLNAKVCSDKEFVRPLTQFPDAINISPTDMVNGLHDKFIQFSIDHKKQEVDPISSGLVIEALCCFVTVSKAPYKFKPYHPTKSE